jgi:hypothetical protein
MIRADRPQARIRGERLVSPVGWLTSASQPLHAAGVTSDPCAEPSPSVEVMGVITGDRCRCEI